MTVTVSASAICYMRFARTFKSSLYRLKPIWQNPKVSWSHPVLLDFSAIWFKLPSKNGGKLCALPFSLGILKRPFLALMSFFFSQVGKAPSRGAHQDTSEFSQLCGMEAQCFSPVLVTVSLDLGVPNLQDLMNDDLRWSWCNNSRNVRHLNHPQTSPPSPSTGILSFMKTVPGAKKVGDPCKSALPSDFIKRGFDFLSSTSASLSLAQPCPHAPVSASAGSWPCLGGRWQLGAGSYPVVTDSGSCDP